LTHGIVLSDMHVFQMTTSIQTTIWPTQSLLLCEINSSENNSVWMSRLKNLYKFTKIQPLISDFLTFRQLPALKRFPFITRCCHREQTRRSW